MFGKNSEIVVLGAGLAGLAAGSVLSRAGARIKVIEGGPVVGGLARTMDHRGFKFDLGGHRFITKSDRIERFPPGSPRQRPLTRTAEKQHLHAREVL